MLKAEELRIGNKIVSPFGSIETVFEILDNTDRGFFDQKGYEHLILVNENRNQYKPVELHPGIPISKDWLVNMNFNEISNGWALKGKGSGFALIIDNGRGFVPASCGNIISWKTIEYVHQLQNLYYSLTGTELTIKG